MRVRAHRHTTAACLSAAAAAAAEQPLSPSVCLTEREMNCDRETEIRRGTAHSSYLSLFVCMHHLSLVSFSISVPLFTSLSLPLSFLMTESVSCSQSAVPACVCLFLCLSSLHVSLLVGRSSSEALVGSRGPRRRHVPPRQLPGRLELCMRRRLPS